MSFFKNVKIMGVNALIRVYFRIHIYALNMFLTIHTICMTDEHMNCPPPFFLFSPPVSTQKDNYNIIKRLT